MFAGNDIFNSNGGYEHINRMNQDYSGNFSSNQIPCGPHTLPAISNNVAAARASAIMGGGSNKMKGRKHTCNKINCRKIKNISNMYKMTKNNRRKHRRSLKQKLMSGGAYGDILENANNGDVDAEIDIDDNGNDVDLDIDQDFAQEGGKRRRKRLSKMNKRRSKKNKSKRVHFRKSRRNRTMKGGYSQFLSNVPYTPSYSTGGILAPTLNALANPVPYKIMDTCVDNYNHYTSKMFK
jgi:hypothetical protein